MENRKFGALSSSVDPTKLATTVSGLIITFSSLIIYGASWLGFPILDVQVSAFATQVGLAIGSLTFLYGVVRKAIVAMSAKF